MNQELRNLHFHFSFSILQSAWYAGSHVGNVTEVVGSGVASTGTQIAVTVMAAIGWFVLLGGVVVVILLVYRHKKKKKKHS